MSRWEKIGVVVTLVFIGIPTAARFYPPLVAGVAEQLPLDFILTWMGRLGLIALGGLGGWYLRGRIEESTGKGKGHDDRNDAIQIPRGVDVSTDENVESIEGCIEIEGACWRGIAELSGEELDFFDVPYRAICPNCQTVMYDGEGSKTPSPVYWSCPSCDHSTLSDYDILKDARKLFESHIRRITESEGEEYSLDNLIDNIEGEVTPRGIWEEYARIADDDNVSLNCFH